MGRIIAPIGYNRAMPPPLKKRFGQHFLHDAAVLAALTHAIAPTAEDHFLEIGPGDGALTDRLHAAGATVTALELDRRYAARLQHRYAAAARVTIHCADALAADWLPPPLPQQSPPTRLAGNLPYNISAPLLFKMTRHARALSDCHIMVQKEVATRLCARPGAAAYGRLSVGIQLHFTARHLMDVPPQAFFPPPAVHSAVLRLTPPPTAPAIPPALNAILAAAFNQRRKTLKNALHPLISDWRDSPIPPGRRAQELAPAEFIALAAWFGTTAGANSV